jgi:hypothetical protein
MAKDNTEKVIQALKKYGYVDELFCNIWHDSC